MTNQNITACIDGSAISTSVCDMAAWASQRLEAPIKFLHVLEKAISPATEDLSGAIGLGSREHLLEAFTELDEQRGKLAIEHGKHILADATERANSRGAFAVTSEQRHGEILETLLDYEERTRLFVVGRLGEDHDLKTETIGSHIESMVRAIHTPILVAIGSFEPPKNYLVAYDGSETANKAIEKISKSPLLKGLEGHIVMIGEASEDNQRKVQGPVDILASQGYKATPHLRQGDVVGQLEAFQSEHAIGLKIMGAYGHSRFREFFVGSNTTKMIGSSSVPLILLR